MATNYQILVDAVNQIEHDQSLFESELSNELLGALHSELVDLGGKMIRQFKAFVEMGKFFSEQQQPHVLTKMLEAIHYYESLLMPRKVCWGYCPCLKPARSGPEYEKRYLLARTKVVGGTFLAHAILVETRAEKINMESMHFADYANKMNNIFNTLSSIDTRGNEVARENAKAELLLAFEMVSKFMKSFEEETSEFRGECRRRLSSTNELLTSRPSNEGGVVTRRILVKAQSSLQEIMNSCAGISMSRSKDAIHELELYSKELIDARNAQVNEFNALEDRMHHNNIVDALHRLKEDMELVHSDASSKIRDSIKRWNTVKSQSNTRPVAEYVEENSISSGIGGVLPTPGKQLVKQVSSVGKDIKEAGKDITEELGNITRMPSNLVMSAVNLTTGAVEGGVSLVSKGASKTSRILGLGSDNYNSDNHKYTQIVTGDKLVHRSSSNPSGSTIAGSVAKSGTNLLNQLGKEFDKLG